MTQQAASLTPSAQPLPTSSLAMVSLVTGILGFFGPVPFSLIAIITGYAARQDTRAAPPRVSGDGLATAGILMGWIQIGLVTLVICVSLALMLLGLGIWISLAPQ